MPEGQGIRRSVDRVAAAAKGRLALDRYADRVLEPASERGMRVAVVGAGLSGLACARVLTDHGHRVRVFDKGRGPGGRMSTRRSEDWSFDHGAQYFTVRDRRFARWVDSWRADGVVSRWTARTAVLDHGAITPKDDSVERFVGKPGMNAICRHLAQDLDVTFGARIDGLSRSGDGWRIATEDELIQDSFDAVVVSAPPAQTADLLEGVAPGIAERASAIDMAPCWAVMAGFAESLDLGFDGAFVHRSPLSWVARNASKPGRPGGEAWVLHASPEWSWRHLEREREDVARDLLQAFAEAIGGLDADSVHLVAHRWRYALPTEPSPEPCLFDRSLAVAACGDWCGGPRVEGAFLSGCAAAGRILALDSGPEQPSLLGPE